MTIKEVSERIRKANAGIREEIVKCMGENSREMVASVREQLYSGVDGNDAYLSPTYENDPYFREKRAGFYDEDAGQYVSCYLHPERYIAWKMRITPPEAGRKLGLPARPAEVPNLFIFGTFHGSIDGRPTERGVEIFTSGWTEGPEVERKYGSQIFGLGPHAVAHFNETFLWPWLISWLEEL